MKKQRLAILAVSIFILSSCSKGPSHLFMHNEIRSEQKNDFKLELLFQKDGCNVYRFYDGRWIYWSSCQGNISEEHTEGTSKARHKVITESITSRKP